MTDVNKKCPKCGNTHTTPKTVAEAVDHILVAMSNECQKEFVERDIVVFHHTLGTQIRNSFGLWGGNKELLDDCERLEPAESEKVNGMLHPDDASTTIMKALRKRILENMASEKVQS